MSNRHDSEVRDLGVETLRALINYEPATGAFTWLANRPGLVRAGAAAGSKNRLGYLIICVAGRAYKAHRLAWLHIYGRWPNGDIDHIDGNPSNNRLTNLREATRSQNVINGKVRADSSSGVTGVYRIGNRWWAEICHREKRIYLGCFPSKQEAAAARLKAAIECVGGPVRSMFVQESRT